MKVSVMEIKPEEEEEIIIHCHKLTSEVLELVSQIKKRTTSSLVGLEGESIHRISFEEVCYFETVDNKSFLYCMDGVFESKLKLYEFLEIGEGRGFFRASKSVVLNSKKIDFIRPALSGRFEANLENGEKVVVSRQYVPELKKCMGL